MNHFTSISPAELSINPFRLIGSDWMLVTAEKEKKVNTMTASWGGLGVMWGKNVAFVVIRPQRYTHEFLDASATFSLSFFEPEFKDKLSYLGKVSGRDEDKITQSGLTTLHLHNTPAFSEAKMILICRKCLAQPFKPEAFLDTAVEKQWYPNADHHTLYIAEITHAYVKS